MAWTVGSERMAQHRLDDRIASSNVVPSLAARVLAFGDAVDKRGQCFRDGTQTALSPSRDHDLGSLSQDLQETVRPILKSWKNRLQILIPQVAINGFAQHAAKVSGHGKVASFVKLRLV